MRYVGNDKDSEHDFVLTHKFLTIISIQKSQTKLTCHNGST